MENTKKVTTVRKDDAGAAKRAESSIEAINEDKGKDADGGGDVDAQIKDCISAFIFKETKDSHFASLVTSWNAELSSTDVLKMMKAHLED